MPPIEYDSESEDNPRIVLDRDADFTLINAEPSGTFKLRDFNPMVEDEHGNMIPFPGLLSIRPVPSPAQVQRARAAMGGGANGVWVGTVFGTPGGSEVDPSPMSLFAPRLVNTATPGHCFVRFVLRRRHVPRLGSLKTMLIFTDGSCLDNGSTSEREPRAGWAFIFNNTLGGKVWGPLEQKGPDNQPHRQTSNRAELRAVIAALEYRVWWGETWDRVVIATDSEYLVNGATKWLQTWARRGWRTSGGSAVQNRDLWEKLSERLGMFADGGCEVCFWRIPRAWNSEADRAAKDAAENGQVLVEYGVRQGLFV